MSKYRVTIQLEEYEKYCPLNSIGLETQIVNAETIEQALALLDVQVNRAWRTLKQSILTDTVEIPDITNNIETK